MISVKNREEIHSTNKIDKKISKQQQPNRKQNENKTNQKFCFTEVKSKKNQTNQQTNRRNCICNSDRMDSTKKKKKILKKTKKKKQN